MEHAVKFADDGFRLRYDSLGLADKLSDVSFCIPQPFDLASVIRPNVDALPDFHQMTMRNWHKRTNPRQIESPAAWATKRGFRTETREEGEREPRCSSVRQRLGIALVPESQTGQMRKAPPRARSGAFREEGPYISGATCHLTEMAVGVARCEKTFDALPHVVRDETNHVTLRCPAHNPPRRGEENDGVPGGVAAQPLLEADDLVRRNHVFGA